MSAPRPPVVVIHGFLSPALTNLPVHLALRRRGFDTCDTAIPGLNTQDPRLSSVHVHDAVQRAQERTGSATAHLVGVSLGGVIGLSYLHTYGADHVSRFVSLGAPFQGTRLSRLARPLAWVPGYRRAARTIGLLAVDGELVRWLNAEPAVATEIYAIYADADPMVPPPGATLPYGHNVRAAVGQPLLAHHQLVLHPRNLALLGDLLQHGEAGLPPAAA